MRLVALARLGLVLSIAWFVCWVAVAARLTLPSEIVDADLARFQTVEEGFEVGQAYGKDCETLH